MPDIEATETTTAETPVESAETTAEISAPPESTPEGGTPPAPVEGDTSALLSRLNAKLDTEEEEAAPPGETAEEAAAPAHVELPDFGPIESRLVAALGQEDGSALSAYLKAQAAKIAELEGLLGRHTGEFDQVKAKVGGIEKNNQESQDRAAAAQANQAHAWFNERKSEVYGSGAPTTHNPAQRSARAAVDILAAQIDGTHAEAEAILKGSADTNSVAARVMHASRVLLKAKHLPGPLSWSEAVEVAKKLQGNPALRQQVRGQNRTTTINPGAVRGGGAARKDLTPIQEHKETVSAFSAKMASFNAKNRG